MRDVFQMTSIELIHVITINWLGLKHFVPHPLSIFVFWFQFSLQNDFLIKSTLHKNFVIVFLCCKLKFIIQRFFNKLGWNILNNDNLKTLFYKIQIITVRLDGDTGNVELNFWKIQDKFEFKILAMKFWRKIFLVKILTKFQ